MARFYYPVDNFPLGPIYREKADKLSEENNVSVTV